jgi:AcrR family transcriptional regulator
MNKAEPILLAAKDAFIENGFANTSMDDVALRAGTTKRTVYNNFGSKERLLEAVIDHAIDLFDSGMPALKAAATDSEAAKFFEILLQLVTWRAAIGLQRLIIAEGATFPHLTQRLAARTVAAMHAPLSRYLRERGVGEALLAETTAQIIDLLTSKARLDRLVGLRKPYPSLPGKNQLDSLDKLAVHVAVLQLARTDGGENSEHLPPDKRRQRPARTA